MFKMNSGAGGGIVSVHPSATSVDLFSILSGKYAYVHGQTMYSSLRNPSIFSRQLFMHFYNAALNSCTYDNVLADWHTYLSLLLQRWPRADVTSASFKRTTFAAWARSLQMSVQGLLLRSLYTICHTRIALTYERFVDWAVTLGLVPVTPLRADASVLRNMQDSLDGAYLDQGAKGSTLTHVYLGLKREINKIMEPLLATYIPDYSEAAIFYNPDLGAFQGTANNKPIKVVVITRPIVLGPSLVFDTPLQRLHQNILSCYRTAEHAKVCQLLNTHPVKSLIASSTNNIYKDILNHLEQSSKKTDPRREMLKLLVKLAENKTISGVQDIVDEFITDVSQQVVDKNKLFGAAAPSNTATGLKKQVSNTVFKCLTNQINEQFDVITNLQN